MSLHYCDNCGQQKDIYGGMTCSQGHFVCKDCGWGHQHCPLCGHTVRKAMVGVRLGENALVTGEDAQQAPLSRRLLVPLRPKAIAQPDTMTTPRKERQFEYDVCLSFAGEDRAYVRRVAAALRERGVRVFYDEYAEAELWGKDLYVHLDQMYRDAARYCVLFVSKHYARKVWTNHERESAQARALEAHGEYILPARFDGTSVPGLRETVGFVSLSGRKPEQFADLVCKKLGPRQRANYFPPVPDRLFKALRARDKRARDAVLDHAYNFMQVLSRMTESERDLVFKILSEGCPAELPENVHINIDLLRRCTGTAPARIKRVLGGLSSLGFTSSLREDDENKESLGKREMLVVTWSNLSVDAEAEAVETSTAVAHAMVRLVTEHYCSTCAPETFRRLDFGQLATVTSETDHHYGAEAD